MLKEIISVYLHTSKKRLVNVLRQVQLNSKVKIPPLELQWEDGREFEIDKVLGVRPAASLKAGGCGIRYTCRILGQLRYLFLKETAGSWMVKQLI